MIKIFVAVFVYIMIVLFFAGWISYFVHYFSRDNRNRRKQLRAIMKNKQISREIKTILYCYEKGIGMWAEFKY